MFGGKCDVLHRTASLQMRLLRKDPVEVQKPAIWGRAGLAKGTPIRHARGAAKRPDSGTETQEDEEAGGERLQRGHQGPAGPSEDSALNLVRWVAPGQGCAQ